MTSRKLPEPVKKICVCECMCSGKDGLKWLDYTGPHHEGTCPLDTCKGVKCSRKRLCECASCDKGTRCYCGCHRDPDAV